MYLITRTIIPILLTSAVVAKSEEFDNALDLDALMSSDVQLTSVMRRLQSAHDTAASVYVLSGEDIQRSGVTSIPQALKLVPGLTVRQIDNNTWAITARGSASRYASKFLVMVDGMSLYNPIHAGVNWENLKVSLIDIDKIEVIRGQGSLLWGSNATNGVINIITKHSEDTRGTALQANSGSSTDYNVTGRYGNDLGAIGSYRIYAMSDKNPKSSDSSRGNIGPGDDSHSSNVGGRLDLNIDDDLFVLMKSNYTKSTIGSNVYYPDLTTNIADIRSSDDEWETFNLLSRAEHTINANTNQMFQLDYSYNDDKSRYYGETTNILNSEYQMNMLLDDYQIDWGINYRYINLDFEGTDYASLLPDINKSEQYGAFLQLQIDLTPETLKLILGNKSEHNDFTGWEHQPNAKLVWLPNKQNTVWGSVSRGVRIPSITEDSAQYRTVGKKVETLLEAYNPAIAAALAANPALSATLNTTLPARLVGNSNIDAETSVSTELGYRYAGHNWDLDLSLFYTETKDSLAVSSSLSPNSIQQLLAAPVASIPGLVASTSIINQFVSGVEIDSYGGELIIGKSLSSESKLEFGYSYLDQDYKLDSSLITAIGYTSKWQQILLKLSTQITPSHSLFAQIRYEDSDAYNTDNFYALDLSWKWQISPTVQLGVAANNLLHGDKVEFNNANEMYTIPTYIEPSVNAGLLITF